MENSSKQKKSVNEADGRRLRIRILELEGNFHGVQVFSAKILGLRTKSHRSQRQNK